MLYFGVSGDHIINSLCASLRLQTMSSIRAAPFQVSACTFKAPTHTNLQAQGPRRPTTQIVVHLDARLPSSSYLMHKMQYSTARGLELRFLNHHCGILAGSLYPPSGLLRPGRGTAMATSSPHIEELCSWTPTKRTNTDSTCCPRHRPQCIRDFLAIHGGSAISELRHALGCHCVMRCGALPSSSFHGPSNFRNISPCGAGASLYVRKFVLPPPVAHTPRSITQRFVDGWLTTASTWCPCRPTAMGFRAPAQWGLTGRQPLRHVELRFEFSLLAVHTDPRPINRPRAAHCQLRTARSIQANGRH